MEIDFKGKRALVTGGGRGFGEAIALKLAELGAKVFVVDINAENLDKLKSKEPSIETRCADITDWEKIREVVQVCLPIDLLVNNAGCLIVGPLLHVTKQDLDKVHDVNFKAMFNISQVVAKDMVERGTGGSIVNLASVAALRALSLCVSYCTSKAAVDMLTKCLAVELAPHKIRVNCVGPTVALTDMGKQVLDELHIPFPTFKSQIPVQRFVEISDVVNAVMYLLSDKSEMITGTLLPIDGAQIQTL